MFNKLLILENDVILNLLSNNSVINAFPFLKNIKSQLTTKPAGCGRCGKSAIDVSHFRAIRMAVANLPPEARQKFKQITGADQVKIQYKDNTGKIQTVVF